MKKKTTHGEYLHYKYHNCKCLLCMNAMRVYISKNLLFRRCFQILEIATNEVERVKALLEISIENQIEDYVMRRPVNVCVNCNREYKKVIPTDKCEECTRNLKSVWYKKPQYNKKEGYWYKPESKEYIRIRTRLPAYWTQGNRMVFIEGNKRYYCDPATYEVREWAGNSKLEGELAEIESDILKRIEEMET